MTAVADANNDPPNVASSAQDRQRATLQPGHPNPPLMDATAAAADRARRPTASMNTVDVVDDGATMASVGTGQRCQRDDAATLQRRGDPPSSSNGERAEYMLFILIPTYISTYPLVMSNASSADSSRYPILRLTHTQSTSHDDCVP